MNIYADRVDIVRVTGYAGQELDRLLVVHPRIRVSGRFASKRMKAPGAEPFSLEKLRSYSPDVVVLATEHKLSMHLVPEERIPPTSQKSVVVYHGTSSVFSPTIEIETAGFDGR
jgi:N-acetyl-gamma-glutamylphosphate reductase